MTTYGALESLENILSMEACNSMVSLNFGVVVNPIFRMLPFQIQSEGGVGLVKLVTALVLLSLKSGV